MLLGGPGICTETVLLLRRTLQRHHAAGQCKAYTVNYVLIQFKKTNGHNR